MTSSDSTPDRPAGGEQLSLSLSLANIHTIQTVLMDHNLVTVAVSK